MRINHNINGSNLSNGVRSVFIGIPTYDAKPETKCFASVCDLMLLLQKNGIGSKLMFSKYDCFIDRARNMLINAFLESECTHMLMNDQDQGFEAEKILKMLDTDKDFVAAAVRQKQEEETYAIKVNIYEDMQGMKCIEEDRLISTHRIGMALCLMKRELFTKLDEFHKLPKVAGQGTHYADAHITQNLQHSLDWDWVGEDYDFCEKCTDAGIKLWIYPDVNVSHVGKKVFEGNFHQFLCRQPGGSACESVPEANLSN